MQWIHVKAIFESDDISFGEDIVSDIFFSLGLKGVVCQVPLDEPPEGFGSDALPIPDETWVSGYIPDTDSSFEIINSIQKRADEIKSLGITTTITTEIVDQKDWAESWKKFFHVSKITDKIVVKPTWREFTPAPDDIVIEIDPGMAFGTGTHPTTSMCISLIEKYLKYDSSITLNAAIQNQALLNRAEPAQRVKTNIVENSNNNKRFLDIGTGSGILMIAAAKLGASYLVGIDTDEVAVQAAKDNIIKNNIPDFMFNVEQTTLDQYLKKNFYQHSLDSSNSSEFSESYDAYEFNQYPDVLKFDLIAANIIAEVLIEIMHDIKKCLKQDGIAILSGIIKERESKVIESLNYNALKVLEVKSDGEWVSMVIINNNLHLNKQPIAILAQS